MSWDDASAPGQLARKALRHGDRRRTARRVGSTDDEHRSLGDGRRLGCCCTARWRAQPPATRGRAPSRSVRSPGSPATSCFRWPRCTSRSGTTTRKTLAERSVRAPRVRHSDDALALLGDASPGRRERHDNFADHVDRTAVPDDRRTEDQVRRQRRLGRAGGAVDESMAGEHLRVRADVGDARRARPSVRGRPSGVRCVRAPDRICCLPERWASSWPG